MAPRLAAVGTVAGIRRFRKFRKTRNWESVDVRRFLRGLRCLRRPRAQKHHSQLVGLLCTSLLWTRHAVARAVHGSKSAPQSPRHRRARSQIDQAEAVMRILFLLMCLHPAATRQMGKPRAVLFDLDGSSRSPRKPTASASRGRRRACLRRRALGRGNVGKKHGVDRRVTYSRRRAARGVIEDLRQRVVSDAGPADVAPTKGGLELLKALREAAVPRRRRRRARAEACGERGASRSTTSVAGDDVGAAISPRPTRT